VQSLIIGTKWWNSHNGLFFIVIENIFTSAKAEIDALLFLKWEYDILEGNTQMVHRLVMFNLYI
jgi:hypothetical protein